MKSLFGKDKVFYGGQIRKYTAIVGSLFADLYICRESQGKKKDFVKVPIKYGPGFLRNRKDKDNPNIVTGLVLPAMSFELISLTPDSTRKTAPYIRFRPSHSNPDDLYSEDVTRSALPHDITYNLYIRARNIEDTLQIVEQIISAFNPQVTIKIIDNNALEIDREITIKLEQNYEYSDNYENSQEDERFVEVTMNITVKGYIYKQIERTPVILEIAFDDGNNNVILKQVATQSEIEDYLNKGQAKGIEDLLARTKEG